MLQYRWEVYCWVSFLEGLEAKEVQRYKWGAYCRANWRCTAVLSPRPVGVGVSEILLMDGALPWEVVAYVQEDVGNPFATLNRA